MATWVSNGADVGGSGVYAPGTQSVQYILNTFANTNDTITLPTGSFTWSTGVTCNKSVIIMGSGYTPNTSTGGTSPGAPTLSTHITWTATGTALVINSVAAGAWFRLSGIDFIGITTDTNYYLNTTGSNSVTGSVQTDPYRIDNCSFSTPGNNQIIFWIELGNPVGCLCDHCTFIGGEASEMIHNQGMNAGSNAGWEDNIFPGTNQLIYWEDCLFQMYQWNSQQYPFGTSGIQTYYGGRNSIRYSSFYMCQIDQHGGQTLAGTRWFEFHDITFYASAPNVSNVSGNSTMALRGGSGFVYNITCMPSGYTAQGGQVYSDQVTPCGYGPGNGIFVGGSPQVPDNSSPVYIWALSANTSFGTQNGVSGPNDIALNRNFFISTSMPTNMTVYETSSGAIHNYVYTPYTYPHPLIAQTTGGSTTPIDPGASGTGHSTASTTHVRSVVRPLTVISFHGPT